MSDDAQDRKDRKTPSYSIGELAALGGVSRRTVRYYVQRGLLEAPTGLGRGRHYRQRHLDALIRIRKLQEAGRPLAEIAAELASPATPQEGVPPEGVREALAGDLSVPAGRVSRWTRVEIDDGIELHLHDVVLDSQRAPSVVDAIRRIVKQGGRR